MDQQDLIELFLWNPIYCHKKNHKYEKNCFLKLKNYELLTLCQNFQGIAGIISLNYESNVKQNFDTDKIFLDDDTNLYSTNWILTDINSYGLTRYNIVDAKSLEQNLKRFQVNNQNKNALELLNEKIESQQNKFSEDIQAFTYKGCIILEVNFQVNKIFFKNEPQQVKIKITFIMWLSEPCAVISIEKESLEEQIIQLKEMDSYKDKLLQTVAHDLRNPLNSMMYLIDQTAKSDTKQFEEEELEILNGNSKILMSLINDIFDYCSHKHQKLRFAIETFYLSDMVSEIYFTMKILVKLKNLSMKISNKLPEDAKITSDRRRITQILLNLICNALKFTRKGQIKLKIYQKNGQDDLIYFAVKDTGSGMTEDKIRKLDGEYNTFGQCINDNKEGVGLGLYISKQIISALGPLKTFKIQSQMGCGSKFYFPIFRNYSQYNQVNEEEQMFGQSLSNCGSLSECKIGTEINKLQLQYNTSIIQNQSFKFSSNSSIPNKNDDAANLAANIMIVDDNLFNLFVLKKQLQKLNENFNIFEAGDGQEAVEIYENNINQFCIKLIIMDCSMPIMNGYDATKIIKEKAKQFNESVRIIGYTAYFSEDEVVKCKSYGMDDCLSKPSPESILFETINRELLQVRK